MDFSQNEASPVRRFGGISIVILFHVLVAYALVTGLARKVVDVIREPLDAKIIEEIKPPPLDKPPPPPPKAAVPPPSFIPPPEVQIPQPTQPNVVADTTPIKPPTPDLAPVAKPEPQPVAAPVRVGPVVSANACEKPQYPISSFRNGEEGVVVVSMLVGADGRVKDSRIEKSSGYKELDKATRAALSLCVFKPGTLDGNAAEMWVPFSYKWTHPEE